jgi:hypothetical protein
MRAFLLSAALVLAVPAVALASGGGLSATYAGPGVTSPGNPNSYVALPSGAHNTMIQEIRDGGVFRWKALRGRFGIPQVAYDGSKTGLSADGRTLVMADIPRTYPIRETRLLVLNAGTFRVLQRIHLKGWYGVDAIAPNGAIVYLVHYLDARGTYEVLAYDRATGERTVIMDPDEPDEKMAGSPIARVTNGPWEYTLYDNAEEPFVHALDTAGQKAECIDLPQLKGQDLSALPFVLDGDTLRVGRVAIDTRVQAVVTPTPTPRATATATPAPKQGEGGMSPWPIAALGIALLAIVVVVLSRRRSVHDVVDLEVTVHAADQDPALRE